MYWFFFGILNFYFSRFCLTNLIVNPKQGTSIHWNWSFQIEDFSPHSDTHITQVHTLTCVCVCEPFSSLPAIRIFPSPSLDSH